MKRRKDEATSQMMNKKVATNQKKRRYCKSPRVAQGREAEK
jgi:hypothetical protein